MYVAIVVCMCVCQLLRCGTVHDLQDPGSAEEPRVLSSSQGGTLLSTVGHLQH